MHALHPSEAERGQTPSSLIRQSKPIQCNNNSQSAEQRVGGASGVKLKTARVTNFRSAEDSGEFEIGPITCLVGKNEAGKSAVLLALAALNPHNATPAVFDKERDYPRRSLTQYDQKHPDKSALAITTTWELEDAEMARLAATVGGGVVTSNVVTVCRRYGQAIEVEASIAFKQALDFLYSKFKLDASERAVLSSATTTSELIKALPALASPTAKHKELQAFLNENGAVTARIQKLVMTMLPKFMYFSSYDRMDGAIQIEQTKTLIANKQIEQDAHRGARLFAEFLDYSGPASTTASTGWTRRFPNALPASSGSSRFW